MGLAGVRGMKSIRKCGNSITGRNSPASSDNENQRIEPVVGWLVCIEGNDKGLDFRIHSDNNFIGRSEEMDICIRGDVAIAKYRQAVASYDARNKRFYMAPCEGRSLVYLNGEPLLAPAGIVKGDIIEIGCTKLLFVPLCCREFSWE